MKRPSSIVEPNLRAFNRYWPLLFFLTDWKTRLNPEKKWPLLYIRTLSSSYNVARKLRRFLKESIEVKLTIFVKIIKKIIVIIKSYSKMNLIVLALIKILLSLMKYWNFRFPFHILKDLETIVHTQMHTHTHLES